MNDQTAIAEPSSVRKIGQQFADALVDLQEKLHEETSRSDSLQNTVQLQEAEIERLRRRIAKIEQQRDDLLRDRDLLYRGSRAAFNNLKGAYEQLMQPPPVDEQATAVAPETRALARVNGSIQPAH